MGKNALIVFPVSHLPKLAPSIIIYPASMSDLSSAKKKNSIRFHLVYT